MLTSKITREQALELLKKYNKETFHIQHGLTVEGVMRWYAKKLGYGDEEEYWGITGLLHGIRSSTARKRRNFFGKAV